MKRFFVVSLLMALTGCSFAPIRIGVPDVEIPGNSSQGLVCYTEASVAESAPANFRGANYRATALYTSVGASVATVTVYGRTTAPSTPCVMPSEADLTLSDPFTLTPATPQEVLIGGSDYGGTLADLITEPTYYLGASLSGGVLLSTQERIQLTNGRISVYY